MYALGAARVIDLALQALAFLQLTINQRLPFLGVPAVRGKHLPFVSPQQLSMLAGGAVPQAENALAQTTGPIPCFLNLSCVMGRSLIAASGPMALHHRQPFGFQRLGSPGEVGRRAAEKA